MAANGAAAEDDKIVFKYVYIPADHTEGIEERVFECPASEDVMGFINMCKAHFTRTSAPRSTEQQQQWQKAFKASMGDKAAGVSDDMINMLAGQQLVEPIALLANSPETGFVGVYMYCDDQATLKHLPTNMRATQIAAEAGQALQVSGDVFIGRYFDNEEDFKRLDFTASELSSSAGWIKDARTQIMRRSQRSDGAQQLFQRLQQQQQPTAAAGSGSAAKPPQSPSEVEKNKGNEAYKKRDYATALEHYTAAIKLDPDNLAARNNRSMAYLALNMFTEAAADTSAVLQADPTNVKALLRQAAAHEGLGQQQEAVTDWRRVLELEPKNADAQQRLAKLQETQPQQPQHCWQQGELPPPPEVQQG